MKQIIKINTIKPMVKPGDIVQFDDLAPVKAVRFKDCALCSLTDACFKGECFCNYIVEDWTNNVMFKAIKSRE